MAEEYENKQRSIPNQDTISAMEEVEYMIQHPEVGKTYSSFSDLLAEVSKEDIDA